MTAKIVLGLYRCYLDNWSVLLVNWCGLVFRDENSGQSSASDWQKQSEISGHLNGLGYINRGDVFSVPNFWSVLPRPCSPFHHFTLSFFFCYNVLLWILIFSAHLEYTFQEFLLGMLNIIELIICILWCVCLLSELFGTCFGFIVH